jgi:hypothetical protein
MDLDANQMDTGTAERLSYGLKMAAHGISKGLDKVTKSCWECDAPLKAKT